jgi:4-hydroxybenzoate polyprenyltransferase
VQSRDQAVSDLHARPSCTFLDAFAFSSALVSCAAAALAAAASRALGLTPEPSVVALAFCGTLTVYCVDRVRDLARDALTSPLRSAFVAAHRRALLAAAALGVCGAIAAGAISGARVVALAGAVAAFGLAHRRLKRFALAKPLYLTGSWAAAAVGLPAAGASTAFDLTRLGFALGIVASTVQANVVLSNLRDAEGIAGRLGARRARGIAAAFCAAAIALALLGPSELRALAALPLAMAAAVAAFRPGERYGAIAVDGALLVGAVGASALM